MVASRDGDAVRVYRTTNVEAQPVPVRDRCPPSSSEVHNEIESDGLELGAIYHSHTRTEPQPSQTDINFAGQWPGVLWIIVGLAGGDPESAPGGSTTAGAARPNWSWSDARRPGRLAESLVCPSCGRRHLSRRALLRRTAGCRWSRVAGGDAAHRRASGTSAPARSSPSSPRAARARRRRAQPGRGRVHPGPAARGGRPEPAAPDAPASTSPTSSPRARATCSSRSRARAPRGRSCSRPRSSRPSGPRARSILGAC